MTGGEPDGGREHGSRYCSRCGQELAERAAAQRSREVRKRVTVLFTDIKGSTVLAGQHDPEVLRPVARRFHQMAREVLERYGASIDATGDGVRAVFGLPRTC
jgi:class 3 adenylate cyclase